MFSLSNEIIIFVSSDCKMASYCLSLNFVLNLCAAVVIQSIITSLSNSLCIKTLLDCFFYPSIPLWSQS